jgi:MFS family permease
MSAQRTAGCESQRIPTVADSVRAAWVTPALYRLLGAASAWGFALSSFYLLPKFLTQELAAGPAEIGLVVGVFGIATVCFTPLAGRCVDRFPRRYAMLAGALLMGASALGFLAVSALGPWILVLRVVQGASYALVVTVVGTMVADIAPPERLGQALGLSGSSMLVMNAVAPAVAEPLAAVAGWHAVFALAAVAALFATLLAAGLADGTPRAPIHHEPGGILALLRVPLAFQYAAVITLAGAAFGAAFAFHQPYALALGRVHVGGFFAAYAAAAIGVRLGFGHLPDRLGLYRVALAALLLYAVVVLLMAAMRPWALEPLGAAFGLAHGIFYPAVNAIAVTAVRPHERGRMMAIFTGSFSLGVWIGTTLLGVVAARAGYPSVFVAAAAGTLGAALVLARSPGLRAAGRRRHTQARRGDDGEMVEIETL